MVEQQVRMKEIKIATITATPAVAVAKVDDGFDGTKPVVSFIISRRVKAAQVGIIEHKVLRLS